MKLYALLITTLLAGCTPHYVVRTVDLNKTYETAYAQSLQTNPNGRIAEIERLRAERKVMCKNNPRLALCRPGLYEPKVEVKVVNNVTVITK